MLSRLNKSLLITLICILLPGLAIAKSYISISSDIYGGEIEVGETFHITIEAVNCNGKLNVNQVPPGVKVVYHTTHSSTSVSTQNGKTTTDNSTTLILTCKGEQTGNYKFGPVSIDATKSNVLNYRIVAASGKAKNHGGATGSNGSIMPDPNSGPLFIGKGNEEMFLKANVNKTIAYEQEAIEYTVKLYTTYGDIKFLGAASAPKFDGFVVEESKDISTSFIFEDYGGKTFKTAVIARYIIFPQKSGNLKIKGNTYTVSTDARQYYHDPYFQTMTVKYPVQLNVTPNDIEINVKSLPVPVPDNFIGGVGKFTLSSSFSNKSLTTNTPASLIYRIEGEGNIKYLKLPDLTKLFPPSIEVYSPDVKLDVNVGKSNVTGSATYDYSIIARETGSFLLPSLEFTYFDPESSQYKTLKTRDFNISVSKGNTSSKSQQALSFNSKLLPIGKLKPIEATPYIKSFLYWLWYIVPVFIFILTLISYRKYLKSHEDIAGLRSKNANKMALKRLAKAYQCIKNHQEDLFYEEMLKALWGYIGDKLKMPVSELNRNNVSEEFKKHGVKESTFIPIINLIDECEYAKYTPVSKDANMRQLYYDALNSLSQVEKEYSEQKNLGKDMKVEDEIDDDNGYINTSSTDTYHISQEESYTEKSTNEKI